MASKRIRVDDLIHLASRMPWRVAVGMAAASGVALHFAARALSTPIHATRLEEIKFEALRSLCWTFAWMGQFILPLILLMGAWISYYAQSRGLRLTRPKAPARRREDRPR
jgi:hypothetical protein